MHGPLKWGVYFTAAVVISVVLCGLYFYNHNYSGYFLRSKGSLIEATVKRSGGDSLFNREWLTLRSSSGLTVECGVLLPVEPKDAIKYPAVILMGGKATGKYAVAYVIDIRNVIIVAPDYSYSPRESYSLFNFIADVPEMRSAALKMVPSVRLVIDYLCQREDVDTSKIILLGYSFGAPFVPCIVAQDHRPAVAAMVFGGGDLYGLIRHNVRRYEGPVASDLVALLGAVLLRPLEPMRYAHMISPVPLVMINGTEDQQILPKFARLFYEKASNPKKIVWLEAHHVNPKNVALTRLIIDTLKSELTGLGILSSQN